MINLPSHGNAKVVCYNDSVCLLPLFRDKISDPKQADFFIGAEMKQGTGKYKSIVDVLSNTITTERGCMEWQGSRNWKGYGQASYKGKGIAAHRLSMLLSGYDIDGWFVCHKCDNPPCINPAHLYLGTPEDNSRDNAERGKYALIRNSNHGTIEKYRSGCRCGECIGVPNKIQKLYKTEKERMKEKFNEDKAVLMRILREKKFLVLR